MRGWPRTNFMWPLGGKRDFNSLALFTSSVETLGLWRNIRPPTPRALFRGKPADSSLAGSCSCVCVLWQLTEPAEGKLSPVILEAAVIFAFGLAMSWDQLLLKERPLTYHTQHSTMATVTGESLKSELEMFDVLHEDEFALDKSE